MEWININDRKPKPLSTVLIWTTVCIQPTIGYYIQDKWLYFSHSENFWLDKEPHIKVLYWMELPDPPKDLM